MWRGCGPATRGSSNADRCRIGRGEPCCARRLRMGRRGCGRSALAQRLATRGRGRSGDVGRRRRSRRSVAPRRARASLPLEACAHRVPVESFSPLESCGCGVRCGGGARSIHAAARTTASGVGRFGFAGARRRAHARRCRCRCGPRGRGRCDRPHDRCESALRQEVLYQSGSRAGGGKLQRLPSSVMR